jgi:hypothetical protein
MLQTLVRGSSQAAWQGEKFFQGSNLRRAMDVCVCLSGADGRVVEEKATVSDQYREVGRVQIPAGWARGHPWMSCCVRIVSFRKEKGEERVGVGGRRKYPGAPPHHLTKKEGRRKKQLVDRKVSDMPGVMKGEDYQKTKRTL